MKKLKTLLSTILLTAGLFIGNYSVSALTIDISSYYSYAQAYYDDLLTGTSIYEEWYYAHLNTFYHHYEVYVNGQPYILHTDNEFFFYFFDEYIVSIVIENQMSEYRYVTSQLLAHNTNSVALTLDLTLSGPSIDSEGNISAGQYYDFQSSYMLPDSWVAFPLRKIGVLQPYHIWYNYTTH